MPYFVAVVDMHALACECVMILDGAYETSKQADKQANKALITSKQAVGELGWLDTWCKTSTVASAVPTTPVQMQWVWCKIGTRSHK